MDEPKRGLLARSPALGRLLAARSLSLVGDGIGTVALVVLVLRTRGTGTSVGLLLLVVSAPSLLSPITGVVADRYDRRVVMAACETVQGAISVAIVVWLPSLPWLLLLVLGRATAATIAEPAGRSAVPALVGPTDLTGANALLGGAREVAQVLGPFLGGVIVALSSVRGALAVDAASFFVGVPLLLRLPALAPARQHEDGAARQSIEGIKYVLRDPVARGMAIAFFLVGFTAADDAALPFLARTLGAGAFGVGLLYAATAFGLVIGYVILLRRAVPGSEKRGIVLGAALLGIGNGLTGIAGWIALAVVFQIVRGVGTALFDANVQTTLQQSVAPEMLGRVFANVYGAVNVAAAISVVVGGIARDATNERVVLVATGILGLAASAAAGALLQRK